jgi:hypothetical protein
MFTPTYVFVRRADDEIPREVSFPGRMEWRWRVWLGKSWLRQMMEFWKCNLPSQLRRRLGRAHRKMMGRFRDKQQMYVDAGTAVVMKPNGAKLVVEVDGVMTNKVDQCTSVRNMQGWELASTPWKVWGVLLSWNWKHDKLFDIFIGVGCMSNCWRRGKASW